MSSQMNEENKRWSAKRKSALVLEIIQGKTTVAEASRQFDLTSSELKSRIALGRWAVHICIFVIPFVEELILCNLLTSSTGASWASCIF